MNQSLFESSEFLFEHLCSESVLKTAFLAVRKNKGAPGVDGVSIKDFEQNLDENIAAIAEDLATFHYKPQPARRAKIPKPTNKRTPEYRNLGIPTVRDRTVQHAIKSLLEPYFEPQFSENSYGFRPGRSARQAVERAKEICESGKDTCVDIDLEKFFDRVNHDRLIARLKLTIKDRRILKLIGMILRSGIMENGLTSITHEGTPQGSPLSPLLSNIVLDELDKELEKRGLEFTRYADDCNIFVKTTFAAERVMESITKFIEKKLKLKVNKEKSKVAKSRNVKFLGMSIVSKSIQISKQSMQRARDRLKKIIPRSDGRSLEATIKAFNQWYRGWSNYYSMTQFPAQLSTIEAHARRRLRAKIVKQCKRPRFLYRKLKRMGVSHRSAARVYQNNKCWATSRLRAMETGFDNKWFEKQGFYTISRSQQAHWYPLNYRARLS